MAKEGWLDALKSAFSQKSEPVISEEARRLIKSAESSDYEAREKVLIINEPHADTRGHVNLFNFLKIFFRDNQQLVKKTVFLSEGTPVNQRVSVKSLIDAEPHPTDAMVEEVLSSHLITGYMAYEWQQQNGIPIVGVENPELYNIGAKSSAEMALGPNPELHTAWNLSVIARNKSIVETVVDKIKASFKPILFVGGMHLNEELTDSDKTIFARYPVKAACPQLTDREAELLQRAEYGSVHQLLKIQKIGYQFLDVKKSKEDIAEVDSDKLIQYGRLFVRQQRNDYDQHINEWLDSHGYDERK